jgi:L-methionine (R)-S-oxide reductase
MGLHMCRKEVYNVLLKQIELSLDKKLDRWTNVCTVLSILRYNLDLFWAGIYYRKGKKLFLGLFQGLPACTEIEIGKGVCGTAAFKAETVIVPNVNDFPGYIACHGETKSEIVVPGFFDGQLRFVLDIDSIELDYFSNDDAYYLEKVNVYISSLLYE